MPKGKRRKKMQEQSKEARKAAMLNAGGKSRYARKATYLDKHGLFGFQVSDPKPWK
jgi:hypothetical protein